MKRKETAYAFFLRNAGYSWNALVGETRIAGRQRCARELARAEARGEAVGLSDSWDEDPDADTSWLETSEDRASARMWSVVVRSTSGRSAPVLASLGGVHEDTRDSEGFQRYRRVVRAELFAEALAEMDRIASAAARAASTREGRRRALEMVIGMAEREGEPEADPRLDAVEAEALKVVRGMLEEMGGGA